MTERKMAKTIILPKAPSGIDESTKEFMEQIVKAIDNFYRVTSREIRDHEDRLVAGSL